MPWYSDEFKKVFEAEAEDENFIPRELSQLLLVAPWEEQKLPGLEFPTVLTLLLNI